MIIERGFAATAATTQHIFCFSAGFGPASFEGTTVAVRNYEGMFLLDSGRYAQDPAAAEDEVKQILEKVGAEILVATPFQESKLAYEIEGRRKGLHFLTFFKLDGSEVEELNRQCRLSELVLRLLVIQQDQRLFDAYVEAYLGDPQIETGEEEEAEAEEVAAS